MTADSAAKTILLAVAKEIRDEWYESGACANYYGRANVSETDDDATSCGGCGISRLPHLLRQWAERLERAARVAT